MRTEINGVMAFPIHGHRKLRCEGYRTRDGHIIEWMSNLLRSTQTGIEVISRPEPVAKVITDRFRARPRDNDLEGVDYIDPLTLRLPALKDRFRWWDDSLRFFPSRSHDATGRVAVVWNPMLGRAEWWPNLCETAAHVHLDLLDDWTVHYAFRNLRAEVEQSYRRMFNAAATVTANSEGTLALAHRFGRSDTRLLTNGVDPDRFDLQSKANGAMTVGYVGKIGERLDLELIANAVTRNPSVQFVFAGPVLDGGFKAFHRAHSNIEWLGDVHYEDVPELLRRFDIGWVPHRVGEGEVGGDVIKTYEYRAAGLPVLSTPIAGISDRGFSVVTVLPGSQHGDWLMEALGSGRPRRVSEQFPPDVTWRSKAAEILRTTGVSI